MIQPVPGPRPGPTGPDLDALRVAFADLLSDSAPDGPDRGVGEADPAATVTGAQVEALGRAHALLSEALESLDRGR